MTTDVHHSAAGGGLVGVHSRHYCARRLASRNLFAAAVRNRARLDSAAHGIETKVGSLIESRRSRLAEAVARIEALSPLSVLGRGYAICERRDDGAIVRTADDVDVGDKVRVQLAHDTLECSVEAAEKSPDRPRL